MYLVRNPYTVKRFLAVFLWQNAVLPSIGCF